ncbi:mitochondrial import inner membrane translocase subunit Tim21-like [Uloborus diversus]|uniref:mitochondrial import inner membrane translocase subunit Tim21-like n=1 Tax=Uloborus diversus TaxID=327109 RepID=UPI002409F7BC|nr:mitochondrial import inner membrane translocase subunit Tim21-like [Uloborus diversus]
MSTMLHCRIHWRVPVIWVSAPRCMNSFVSRSPWVTEMEGVLKPSPFPFQINQLRQKNSTREHSALSEVKESANAELTIAEKVKQTTKDASYLGIIIAGVSVTGLMFYAIVRELFSRQSPNSVYTDALKICRNEPKVVDVLGEPIKGYGELSSRGRRRHVSHLMYEKNGKNYMRMKFYIEGIRKKGTVHLEMKEVNKGKYDYRYLFVDVEGYPSRTIILKDNRSLDETTEVPLMNI